MSPSPPSQSPPSQSPPNTSPSTQARADAHDREAPKAAPVPISGMERAAIRRKTIECVVLTIVSMVGVLRLRLSFESTAWCSAEMVAILATTLLMVFSRGQRVRQTFCIVMLLTPVVFATVARQLGAPIPFEMTTITSFGVISIALALYSASNRNLALSVVVSGFLVLFTTLISDVEGLPITAFVWIAICLWHLVANHWERVSSCGPAEIRRSASVRPVTVVLGFALFAVCGWAMIGRGPDSKLLSWGFMPNSGGSSWSDPAARSGVGSGDAAIAAKDHAESFGAVESELFLESTESTLFDMFSDSIGQPKLKPIWERRQGMTPEKIIHAHQKTAKSERSGRSFSTSRTMPPQTAPHRDAKERAILQWIGATGIRLAMNRHDTFDGFRWHRTANWRNDKLSGVKIGEELWFFDPTQKSQVLRKNVQFQHAGILKVLRLDSTRIPSPMMTAAVYVKDVDRADFFGIEEDGSLFMPGRKKIPTLTVMHLAASSVMEDQLLSTTAFADLESHRQMLSMINESEPAEDDDDEFSDEAISALIADMNLVGTQRAGDLARQLTEDHTNPYHKLCAIVSHLRDHYEFDRQTTSDSVDPLNEFLTTKRGGDHLFATAAAVMAREIGFNTRLVSGFYVRPSAVDIGQGHASIVPEDIHVWAEVQLSDGRWIELEPTPGYRQPIYTPSNWLLTKRFAARYWIHAVVFVAASVLVYVTRVFWFEFVVRLAWFFGRLLGDRLRIRILLWILQGRAKLAGSPRCNGQPQRDWLLSLTQSDEDLSNDAKACCNAADRLVFGGHEASDWLEPADGLVRRLTTRYISRIPATGPSNIGAHA